MNLRGNLTSLGLILSRGNKMQCKMQCASGPTLTPLEPFWILYVIDVYPCRECFFTKREKQGMKVLTKVCGSCDEGQFHAWDQ